MQPFQLANGVATVAAGFLDPIWPKETDQHARRLLPEPSELSDVQHGKSISTPSPNVKVNPTSQRLAACGRRMSPQVAAPRRA
jgi:hypothetical protein